MLDVSALTTVTDIDSWDVIAFSGGEVKLNGMTSLSADTKIADTLGSTILDPNLTSLNGVNVSLDGTDAQLANAWTSFTQGTLFLSGGAADAAQPHRPGKLDSSVRLWGQAESIDRRRRDCRRQHFAERQRHPDAQRYDERQQRHRDREPRRHPRLPQWDELHRRDDPGSERLGSTLALANTTLAEPTDAGSASAPRGGERRLGQPVGADFDQRRSGGDAQQRHEQRHQPVGPDDLHLHRRRHGRRRIGSVQHFLACPPGRGISPEQ